MRRSQIRQNCPQYGRKNSASDRAPYPGRSIVPGQRDRTQREKANGDTGFANQTHGKPIIRSSTGMRTGVAILIGTARLYPKSEKVVKNYTHEGRHDRAQHGCQHR